MPLLDFRCMACGHKFDELVRLSETGKVRCPKCGAQEVKQVFEGRCSFGRTGGSSGGTGCSGSCSGCQGCHH